MEAETDLSNDLKKYKSVYVTLLIMTGVTVGVSYLNVGVKMAVLIALVVATFKASLVAGFFMHLAHEKKLIYNILLLTMFFLVSMFVLMIIAQYDVYEGLQYVS